MSEPSDSTKNNPTKKEIEDAAKNVIRKAVVNPSFTNPPSKPSKNPPSKSSKPNPFPHPSHRTRYIVLGLAIGVAGLIITIIAVPQVNKFLFPPKPVILVSEVNAEKGTINPDGSVYEYSPRNISSDLKKQEIFSVSIINSGEGIANNFILDFDWEPQSDWLDFHSTTITNDGFTKPCPQKSSECIFEIITKEMGSINIQYDATIDYEKHNAILNENPKIIFRYSFNESGLETEVILNILDLDPFQEISNDDDDDGVKNDLDQCPNQKETKNGFEDEDGCPDITPSTNQIFIGPDSSVPGCEKTNSCFIPYEKSVKMGDTISWSNNDNSKHTVSSGTPGIGHDGKFDSGLFGPGTSFEYTFEKAGTFEYFCMLHPWAKGIVIVE